MIFEEEQRLLKRACWKLGIETEGEYDQEVGAGVEHMLHELCHFVLATGRAPAEQEGPLSVWVSEVLSRRYQRRGRDEALQRNEFRTLGLEMQLARRFGGELDEQEVVWFALDNGNLRMPEGWDGDRQETLRRVQAEGRKIRYLPHLLRAERYIRLVGGRT